MTNKKQTILVTVICFFFFVLLITSTYFPMKKSITYDEPEHYESGVAILSGKPSDRGIEDVNKRNIIPASAFNVLISKPFPRSLISKITVNRFTFFDGKTYPDGLFYCGRLGTNIIAIVLAIYIFRWAKQLYGLPERSQ